TRLDWRMCRPFLYDIKPYLRPTGNRLTVFVGNTLANALQDPFSRFLPIAPIGLMGPVELICGA
nr:hypothetical protein [Clostridia bacterium]